MKVIARLAIFCLAIFHLGCAAVPEQRLRHRSSHAAAHQTPAKPSSSKTSDVISGDETGILVEADWMRKYNALEAKHGAIPEDMKIYREGEQYRIPSEAADHFNDMVRSGRTPGP
jgi:hypothetical protein